MAVPKKGQLTQFMVPMVDATDFASVESGITESDFNSGATVKFYGVNHGVSDAFTSGTVSKTARLVRSGVFHLTLKGSENNYDVMQVRVNKTGCAEAIVNWTNTDYDDSDIMSRLSDVGSDLRSMLVGLSAELSNVESQLDLVPVANLSDAVSDILALLSDLDSNFQSRVPKAVATNSQLSDLHSDLRSYLVAVSGALSDVESQLDATQANLSDFESNLLSRVPKIVASQSLLSDVHSDLKSAIGAITVSLDASNISDIASAVVAALPITSAVSDIYSLLSDLNSNFHSRIPKEPAARSQLSDMDSNLLSYLAGMSGAISDIESQLDLVPTANLSDAVSDIFALLSDLDSNFQSRVPKAVATNSQLSDLHSDLRSYVVGNSDAISNVYSLLALVASNVSDVESQIDAGIEVGASSMSDLRSAITAAGLQAAGADPTAVVGVTASYGAKIDWLTAMSRNKITQTSTSAVLFNDAGTAVASATVSDDATTFTRDEWH